MTGRGSVRRKSSPFATGRNRSKTDNTPTNSPVDLHQAIESARLTFKNDVDPAMKRHRGCKSTLSSPKMASPQNTKENKSNSAPPSPMKAVHSKSRPSTQSPRSPRSPATSGDKRQSLDPPSELALTNPKRFKAEPKVNSGRGNNVLTEMKVKGQMGSRKKNVYKDEVSKLHQDEGIYHLLHGLSGSRRKTQVKHFNASNPSVDTLIHAPPARKANGHQKFILPTRVPTPQPSTNKSKTSSKGDLIIQMPVKEGPHVTPELLLNPKNFEQLQKLPQRDYMDLWSGNQSHKLPSEALAAVNLELNISPTESGCSSASSDISSLSNLTAGAAMFSAGRGPVWSSPSNNNPRKIPKRARIGSRMLLCVSNITKQYREIVVRSYPTFAQIIFTPGTTGMQFSFNINVFEEIIDAMQILLDDPTCKAVVFSGLGDLFCQGVDLTLLAFDSIEKQKKSADIMSKGIKTFIKFIVSYPKLTVGAVNGVARGLGVTLLPYLDLVYASDKATFQLDSPNIGYIPEGFASETMKAPAFNEMILLGQMKTAEEAKALGLVTEVFWPDRLFEELVPRLENLEKLNYEGLKATKALQKKRLLRQVSPVMDEETKELQEIWSAPNFHRQIRNFLKTSDGIVFK
ncbi:hypothetical protein TCAL_04659 [Tigriopus californicus]|uniref:Uncharacterized protein n=1 Tax=Tigriopus californicus TaxID=6832 RepID=A0A553NCU7_TIGCA|nr:chromodomain Y-like protein 2 [Tigriopus californicus]TRY63270.1 hypothetical protein TCAL_04659 [Tigriopus californicus]|eukprot:TCALIF_04659-PA protein Name:"Similar to Cdyl Chromodomain Y-like protein (Rattus norvegicus)" AED:0.14 eAED:0.18 QI:0/-1/0/1/-1/1/1/0/628